MQQLKFIADENNLCYRWTTTVFVSASKFFAGENHRVAGAVQVELGPALKQ